MIKLEELVLNSLDEISEEEYLEVNGGWVENLVDTEVIDQLPGLFLSLQHMWKRWWG